MQAKAEQESLKIAGLAKHKRGGGTHAINVFARKFELSRQTLKVLALLLIRERLKTRVD